DKFLPDQLKKGESPGKDTTGREKPTPQQQLVREVAGIGVSDTYQHFFARLKAHLTSMRVQIDGYEYLVETHSATTQGRIAIGLGDESVIETAVALHHTYGVPYIPGSALKGLASAYAHQRLEDMRWRKKGELHTLMFGTTKAAGYVAFFDALYDPN